MSGIYGWIRDDDIDCELGKGDNEVMVVRINVGGKDDSREIIKIIVEDVGDAFVASVDGEEFRRMPKARWEE
jgi:hypothetical protein